MQIKTFQHLLKRRIISSLLTVADDMEKIERYEDADALTRLAYHFDEENPSPVELQEQFEVSPEEERMILDQLGLADLLEESNIENESLKQHDEDLEPFEEDPDTLDFAQKLKDAGADIV